MHRITSRDVVVALVSVAIVALVAGSAWGISSLYVPYLHLLAQIDAYDVSVNATLPRVAAEVLTAQKDAIQVRITAYSLVTSLLAPLVQLVLGSVAVAGLFFTWRSTQIAHWSLEATQRSQLAERFLSAVEQIDGQVGDQAQGALHLGGVHALVALAGDAEVYRQPALDRLAAWLRRNFPVTDDESDLETADSPRRLEVEVVLAALAELRSADVHLGSTNLTGTKLIASGGRTVELRRALFVEAYLDAIEWNGVHLGGARFERASLSGADLSNCVLSDASFWDADLSAANLTSADLRRASLLDADLRSVNLTEAQLQGTDLRGKNLDWDQVNTAFIDRSTRLPTEVEQSIPVESRNMRDQLVDNQVMIGGQLFDSVATYRTRPTTRPSGHTPRQPAGRSASQP